MNVHTNYKILKKDISDPREKIGVYLRFWEVFKIPQKKKVFHEFFSTTIYFYDPFRYHLLLYFLFCLLFVIRVVVHFHLFFVDLIRHIRCIPPLFVSSSLSSTVIMLYEILFLFWNKHTYIRNQQANILVRISFLNRVSYCQLKKIS